MSDNLIQHVTRTIYGSYLQTCRVLRRPLDVREFSTLNEAVNDNIKVPFQPSNKLAGVQETENYDAQTDSDNIAIGYVAIGNGGHLASISSSSNNVSYMDINLHEATDAAPFKMLPFVCKPIDADLSDDERKDYRLRKILEIDGDLYVAYYLKRLDFSNSEVTMTISSTLSGNTSYVPFTPVISNIRCVPRPTGVPNDGTKVFASTKAVFNFNQKDVNLFVEACTNLFGSPNEAIISELAFCSGCEKPIVRAYPNSGNMTSDSTIRTRNLSDVVAVQVCCFANTYYQATFGVNGFDIPFDIGAIEPLFGKTKP